MVKKVHEKTNMQLDVWQNNNWKKQIKQQPSTATKKYRLLILGRHTQNVAEINMFVSAEALS